MLPPYNYVIESYILNVPIVVYFEILAYLLCGILLGSIIGEFIPNETVFNRNIIIFILIMLGLVAFFKTNILLVKRNYTCLDFRKGDVF